MKKLLTVSLVAIMAVSAANAEIASTTYVTDRTGDIATLTTTATNLTGAVNELKAAIGDVAGGDLQLGADAVDTDNIKDGAVTAAKLADGAAVSNIGYTPENAANRYTDTQNYNTVIEDATKYPNMPVVNQMISDSAADATAQITTLNSKVTVLTTTVTNNKTAADNTATALSEYKTSNDAAVAAAQKAADDAQADANANAAAITALQSADSALDGRVDALETDNTTNKSDIANLKSDVATLSGTGEGSVTEKINTVTEKITKVETEYKAADTALAERVSANESAITTINGSGVMQSGVTSAVVAKANSAVQKSEVITGTVNGTISVQGTDVAVKGLGSAAYTDTTAYATAAQGAKADSAMQESSLKALASWTANSCGTKDVTCSLVSKDGTIAWEKVSY